MYEYVCVCGLRAQFCTTARVSTLGDVTCFHHVSPGGWLLRRAWKIYERLYREVSALHAVRRDAVLAEAPLINGANDAGSSVDRVTAGNGDAVQTTIKSSTSAPSGSYNAIVAMPAGTSVGVMTAPSHTCDGVVLNQHF